MIHTIDIKPSKATIICFHGTGGTEHDLLPLARRISPQSTVLGIRGDVNERGMNRFFKRFGPGLFDESSIISETRKIYQEISHLKNTYQLEQQDLYVLGYSNGANIASSLIFHYPNLFKKAWLFHPMKPFKTFEYPLLKGLEVFIAAGRNDPIVTQEETLELIDIYDKQQAYIETSWSSEGHSISMISVQAAHDFLKEKED
jgi:phospholipase/carboxylesterase